MTPSALTLTTAALTDLGEGVVGHGRLLELQGLPAVRVEELHSLQEGTRPRSTNRRPAVQRQGKEALAL